MIRKLLLFAPLLLVSVMPARAADFDHSVHVVNPDTPTCATCHLPEAANIKPEGKVCLDCHEQEYIDQITFPGMKTHGPVWALEHRQAAKAKNPDCAACHEQKLCLDCHKAESADQMGSFTNAMVNVHRSDFHVTHPIAARANPRRCSSCHEPKFCSDCHDEFARKDLSIASHRTRWSETPIPGIGLTHKNFPPDQCILCHPNRGSSDNVINILSSHEWRISHGREARKNLVTCQACHPDGDVCMQCHSDGLRINPHPNGWGDLGANGGFKNLGDKASRLRRASGGRTCRRCH